MSDLKNQRLKDDIKLKMSLPEQKMVLEILTEIEMKGSINSEKAKQIGAKAFQEDK